MNTSRVIFNIPTAIKKAATARAEREGLTLTAILTQAAQAYGEGKIGIEVVETHMLRPVIAQRVKKAIEDAKHGRNISPRFDSTAEAVKWLRSSK